MFFLVFSTKVLFTSYSQRVDTPLCVHQHGTPHANLASASLLWYRWQSYVYFSKYAKQSERKFYKVICWLSHKGKLPPKGTAANHALIQRASRIFAFSVYKKRQGEERTEETCESPRPAVTAISTTFFYPKTEAC